MVAMIRATCAVCGRLLLLAGFLVALCVSARAQTPAAQPTPKAPAATATPSVDQILNRYVEATGGRAAWQKLTSRISTGTIEVPSMNLSGTLELDEKAPNRTLAVITLAGASFRQAFDGTVGWTDDPQDGFHEQSGAELAEARREADFYFPLDLRKHYARLEAKGKEKIGERDTYLLEGTLPEGGKPDRIYFDIQTGLPVRMISEHHVADSASDFQEDFDDFREVDGVKLPFSIRQKTSEVEMIIKIEEVRHNVDIDDARFAKPAQE